MNVSKITLFITGLAVFTLLLSFALPKKFPVLTDQTINGKTIDAAYFANRKTLVIHLYLGCPGAMNAVKDVQAIQDSIPDNVQVLFILENTTDQVRKFNSDEKNDWTMIRNFYKLNPISQDIVAECDMPDLYLDKEGRTVIGSQCNKLSKKLKIKSSPTFLYINGDGKIIKRERGYWSIPDPEKMWEKLNTDF